MDLWTVSASPTANRVARDLLSFCNVRLPPLLHFHLRRVANGCCCAVVQLVLAVGRHCAATSSGSSWIELSKWLERNEGAVLTRTASAVFSAA